MAAERLWCIKDNAIDISNCGCYYSRTHGLPCSHHIAFTKGLGAKIDLNSIHPFWRRLDVEPEEDIDSTIQENAMPSSESLWNDFQLASPALQRHVLRTLHNGLNPELHDAEEPPHVTKANKARKFSSRIPSDWERTAQHFGVSTERPSGTRSNSRNSFIARTQSDMMSYEFCTPPRRPPHGAGPTIPNDTPTSKPPSCFPRGHGNGDNTGQGQGTSDIYSSPYVAYLVPYILPYITGYSDVAGDGNCGYRCIALAVYGDEEQWPRVRMECCLELRAHEDIYRRVISWRSPDKIHQKVAHESGCAPRSKWMFLPDVGHLIATYYNVVFMSYTQKGPITTYPVTDPDGRGPPTRAIVVANIANTHYILLHMVDEINIPMGPPAFYWETAHDPSVSDMMMHFRAQRDNYDSIIA